MTGDEMCDCGSSIPLLLLLLLLLLVCLQCSAATSAFIVSFVVILKVTLRSFRSTFKVMCPELF